MRVVAGGNDQEEVNFVKIVLPDNVEAIELPDEARVLGWVYGHSAGSYSNFHIKIWGVGRDLKLSHHTYRRAVAVDSELSTAERIIEMMNYANSPTSEEILLEKKIEERFFGFFRKEFSKSIGKPPLCKYHGGLIRSSIPFGGDPLAAIEKYSVWKDQIKEVAEWIINEMRSLHGEGGVAIELRSLGGHQILTAELSAHVNRGLRPLYITRFLKIDARVEQLKAFLHQYHHYHGTDSSKMIIFHGDFEPHLSRSISDTVLASCILDILKSSSPDFITIFNTLRERSPYVYMEPAVAMVPNSEVVELERKFFLKLLPIASKRLVKTIRDSETIVESTVSLYYHLLTKIPEDGFGIIVISAPFNTSPKDELELLKSRIPTSTNRSITVIARSGTLSFSPNTTNIYGTIFYVRKHHKLPPYVEKIVGTENPSELEVRYTRYIEAIERLSNLGGWEVRELL